MSGLGKYFSATAPKVLIRRIVLGSIAAALLISAAVYVVVADPFGPGSNADPAIPSMAPNAIVGVMPGKTMEELQALLDAQTKKSEVSFSVNTTVVFEDGWKGEGDIMIECLASNPNYLEFVITRDDTGETIYRSGLLAPNQYILKDKLQTTKAMPKGDYICTTTISSYDMETYEFIGKAQAGITLSMKK